MSAQLVGVTALGGVPLFNRQVGLRHDEQSVPFATLAALNGVNLFSRLNDADLQATSTKHSKIRWKVYVNNIVLILVASTNGIDDNYYTDKILENLLERVFEALVFCSCLDEISNSQNVERLKRSLKSAYPFVDFLLQHLLDRDSHIYMITNSVNYSLVDQSTSDFLSTVSESIAQVAQTDFVSVVINRKLVFATKGWWTRIAPTKDAAVTLSFVDYIIPELERETKNIKDTQVFLPENCPNSVTRLIVAKLHLSVYIIVLCDEKPSVDIITNALNVLKESENCLTNFRRLESVPIHLKLIVNEHIQSLIVYKHEQNLLVMQGNTDSSTLHLLATMGEISSQQTDKQSRSSFKPHESYLKVKNHHCYSVSHEHNKIFLLFSNTLAIEAVREISLQTLFVLKDKKVWPKTA